MNALSAPPKMVTITPRAGWVNLRELWQHRELIVFLAARDLKLRYRQTLLGGVWAVLRPLLTLGVFSLLFSILLGPERLPTEPGVPYAVSTFCALVPWQLFARALTGVSGSLVQNRQLITKVYFPRLVPPLAGAVAAVADFLIALAVLAVVMLVAGVAPSWGLWAVPLWGLLAAAAALALGLWLAAFNALYRDVTQALDFLVQLGMVLTPVVYTAESVLAARPQLEPWLYLNPMAVVVEGFRGSVLGGAGVPAPYIALAVGSVLVMGALGLTVFRRLERQVIDRV